jgi:tRNA-binding protein
MHRRKEMKSIVNIQDFNALDMRVGTVVSARELPNARVPAIVMEIDFGPLGIKKSSARITQRYSPEKLLNRQVIALVNLPPVQIGSVMSECLVLGAVDSPGDVILLTPDEHAQNGSSIS